MGSPLGGSYPASFPFLGHEGLWSWAVSPPLTTLGRREQMSDRALSFGPSLRCGSPLILWECPLSCPRTCPPPSCH